MDLKKIWQSTLGELEVSLSRANFTTWFKGACIYEYDESGNILYIGVPSFFYQEWLEKKYHYQIFETLKKYLPELKEIKYKVSSQEKPILKIEETATNEDACEPSKEGSLMQHYTFESFVVGSSNRLAYATAQAVAKEPGTKYNPLFIYGGVGLGKTHLIQAIGNEIRKKSSRKKILYSPCERFTNEFIDSIQNKKIDAFKRKYRQTDVLLIDDIQFLGGKESTQEEFFHTFNTLYQTNRQIILTSDRPPQALSEVANRLTSRFTGGMVADIKPPDLETRSAILKTKCQIKNLELDEEILGFIATQVQSNIRELEGALNKILIHCELYNIKPTLSTVKKILEDLVGAKVKKVNAQKIIKAVAEHFSVEPGDLLGKSRQKEYVRPRQIAMYFIRGELGFSFPKIGAEFGGKDHTTVMYAVEKVGKELKYSEKLQEDVALIKEKLYIN